MMLAFSTGFKILLLQAWVISVASNKALVDGDSDKIVDTEKLINWKVPASQNSSWLQGDNDWDTWEVSQDMKKNFQYYRSGYDEDGLVVYVFNFGKFNYRELSDQSQEKTAEFQKYFEQFFRRAVVDAAKDDNKGIVIIADFDGFSLRNFASTKALKMALELFIGLLGLNHSCKYGFLINANFAAETFIGLAKPFIGILIEKFQIYGTQSGKWKPILIRKIPASQLPPKYGGSVNWKPLPDQVL